MNCNWTRTANRPSPSSCIIRPTSTQMLPVGSSPTRLLSCRPTLHNAPPGYRLPNGSHVPAGGYLVVPIALTDSPFQLRAKAELLTLFSASANGRLSGYLHNVSFNIPPTGVALGRLVNSDGEAYFAPQRELTLGGPNGDPLAGPVVISQIMLAPTDGVAWLELTNLTDQPVPLYDPKRSGSPLVDRRHLFPPAGRVHHAVQGRLRILSSTPASACMNGQVPLGVYASGPFPLRMSDAGMRLTVHRPFQTSTGHLERRSDRSG